VQPEEIKKERKKETDTQKERDATEPTRLIEEIIPSQPTGLFSSLSRSSSFPSNGCVEDGSFPLLPVLDEDLGFRGGGESGWERARPNGRETRKEESAKKERERERERERESYRQSTNGRK